jgi:tyrosyl-tRNA synthetase
MGWLGLPVCRYKVGLEIFVYSPSTGAAKSLVAMRGLYMNGRTVDAHTRVQPGDLIDGRLIIVRAGRDKHAVFALQR